MATTLHSFIDIFGATIGDGEQAVKLEKITIPKIQRDYAQGRNNPDVSRVREAFIEALLKAVVTEKPITLDFVYGNIDSAGNMVPLDGQQRLTTLFLLHWYAAKKGKISENEYEFLKKFSYETRYSARQFCVDLVVYKPEFVSNKISKEIMDQSWFPLDWKRDPTISSMLVMLDEIQEKFKNVTGLWDKLKAKYISFYFLPIKDMGLTDDIYIRMNSRGRPLTEFENFKAILERQLIDENCKVDKKLAADVIGKIDGQWTNLLWEYRNRGNGSPEDDVIDDEFLCYFKFICDVICYSHKESLARTSYNEIDLLKRYFSSECEEVEKNLKTMESFFDCWCSIPNYGTPYEFLESFMVKKTNGHQKGKILVDEIDLFADCLHRYANKEGRKFEAKKIVLLYAITMYLQNVKKITQEEFKRRIRIVNNLIQNSENEISDRKDNNRMPAILEKTKAIICEGKIDDSSKDFNVIQLKEEIEKEAFLKKYPDLAETLFELEDHPLLYGQIGIVGLENVPTYAKRFASLFKCTRDKVDCAMMARGDYSQPAEKGKAVYQYGLSHDNEAWKILFHKREKLEDEFENTKDILADLLATNEEFSDDCLQKIADDYLHKCKEDHRYPFRYYYIKYNEYLPCKYGRIVKTGRYPIYVLQTRMRSSPSTYNPYLMIAYRLVCEENKKRKLKFKDDLLRLRLSAHEFITCTEDTYSKESKRGQVSDAQKIDQKEGIDTVDRIILLTDYIKR